MYRDRIEELRKEKGLSNKQLAEMSGVSLDTLSRISHPENPDKDSPRINTLEDICKVFGIELWELFYTGTPPSLLCKRRSPHLKQSVTALLRMLPYKKKRTSNPL